MPLQIVRIVAGVVLLVAFGPDVVHALGDACVWLFDHPIIGGPVLAVVLMFGPVCAAGACGS